jgi:hypothetical protein
MPPKASLSGVTRSGSCRSAKGPICDMAIGKLSKVWRMEVTLADETVG